MDVRTTPRQLRTLAAPTPLTGAAPMNMSPSVRVAEAFDNNKKSTKSQPFPFPDD
jgi:hypothetical protein